MNYLDSIVRYHSKHKKKNVDNLLCLRYLRYWGKPCIRKQVNVHAERRELSTSVLECFFKFPNYQITRIKSGRSVLCPLFLYQPRGSSVFIGLHIICFSLIPLFFPIAIHNVCDDAVNHIVEEGLAQEAIAMGNNVLNIKHTHDVGHEI